MSTSAEDIQARAEARSLRLEEKRQSGFSALAELKQAKAAEQAKTARLRELRLAKEAADRTAAASRLLTTKAGKKGISRPKSAGPRSSRGRAL